LPVMGSSSSDSGAGFLLRRNLNMVYGEGLIGEDGMVVGCDCPKSRAEMMIIYE
jgi:hypothetical protein